ncbi:MAG: membrane protein [Acidobacteria bacterium]|nr:MAG: membrane protein [Acidobacteriota bacterium]
MARSIFLRGLAITYLMAFASFLPQVNGLIGSKGILPVSDYLESIDSQYLDTGYALFPTLAWFDSSDRFLHLMIWAGIVLAILLFLRIVPLVAAIGLWVLYLSLDTVGQIFFSFQWDALLLETGFAAILLTPWGLRPLYRNPPPRMAIWLFRFLIFRLTLESGAVKLLSGDPTWRSLTALNYHYETQPLPTPPAWFAHHLPAFVQKISVIGVFAIELVVPFLFLTTRPLRRVGALITIAFQCLIAFTGNYTFFNLLTIVLCFVPLFDDGEAPEPRWSRWVVSTASVALIALGLLQLLTMFGIPGTVPERIASIDFRAQTFHIVNRYGLFAVMTTTRPEIIIEGSDDAENWKAYEFKYKPGDVNRPLTWVAPYQPRLDWQMWFAALSNYQDNPWFPQLLRRLLEGSPDVLNLLAINPFPNKPPRLVRARTYDYHFSDAPTRRRTGAIWTRRYLGEYFPVVGLKQ